MFVFVWLRGTLPRIRYDQFMSIGWKVLIPVSLVWIVLVGAVRVLRNAEGLSTTEVLLWVGHPAGGGADRRDRLAGAKEPVDDDELDGRVTTTPCDARGATASPAPVVAEARGRYPIPPLDLEVPVPPIRAAPAAAGRQRAAGGRPPDAGAGPTNCREAAMSFLDPVKGFGVTFSTMFKPVVTEDYPKQPGAAGPALPRSASAEPASRRAGEVRRLRAVRLGLPGGRDLRRGRRQHRRGALLARASGTGRTTRSTTCAASAAGCASRPARPGR